MNDPSKSSGALADMSGIRGGTRICAVIGDPIAHSLSPPIHNAAFRSLGMDLAYVAFRVRRRELATAVEGIRGLGILGVNVMRPHKTTVVRFLDTIDGIADEIGAVNTIVRTPRGLRGYNTDGQAALEVLQNLGGSLSGRKTVILGAGGAARAIAYYLSKTTHSISILNRTRSKGSRMAAEIRRWSGTKSRAYGLNRSNLRRETSQADLLINTLPADAFSRFGAVLIQEGLVRPGMIVFDVNYNSKGDFLANAKHAGAKVTDGLEMLIGQAALSFKLWTGQDPPIDIMHKAAILAREARAW